MTIPQVLHESLQHRHGDHPIHPGAVAALKAIAEATEKRLTELEATVQAHTSPAEEPPPQPTDDQA